MKNLRIQWMGLPARQPPADLDNIKAGCRLETENANCKAEIGIV